MEKARFNFYKLQFNSYENPYTYIILLFSEQNYNCISKRYFPNITVYGYLAFKIKMGIILK